MKIFKSSQLLGDGRIGLQRKVNTEITPEHTHDYIEIVYVLDGTAIEYVDGIRYDVCQGDVLFMTPNSIHSFIPNESFEHIEIFFSPRLIGESVMTSSEALSMLALSSFDNLRRNKSFGHIKIDKEEIPEIEAILQLMCDEWNGKKEGYEGYMCNCLNMLLIKLLRIASAEIGEGDVWQAVIKYIDGNYEKRIDLNSLASKCFYNPSYFSRVFKQKYGLSLTAYIKRKRILKAKELLISGELTVDEIIKSVGCADKSAFYSEFKKETGITPDQYRKENKCKN